MPDWKDPEKAIEVGARNVQRDGRTVTEQLADDPIRAAEFERWKAAWQAWAVTERPARAAMRVFEDFYELHGKIELESDRVELMLGDGRLRWQRADAVVDHPVLLQRVELEFDANVPEFRVVDADRSPELYGALVQDTDGMSGEQVQRLRQELEAGGYHPLARDGTSGYLRRLAQTLGAHGKFSETRSDDPERKTNRAEAETVVALLAAMTQMPQYRGRTMGAITLLGDEQAQLIQHLAVPLVGAAQLERRRFASAAPRNSRAMSATSYSSRWRMCPGIESCRSARTRDHARAGLAAFDHGAGVAGVGPGLNRGAAYAHRSLAA
ncbi:MAG: hypothetical protein ACREMQ_09840 [Longimicrobiales bacterium]